MREFILGNLVTGGAPNERDVTEKNMKNASLFFF